MPDPQDVFVIKRLRAKPIEYTVRIKHFVSGGEWMMSVGVEGVTEDEVNKSRVSDDLRHAADMMTAKQS